jgi:SOS-response transcriptional repressor LexA
MMKPSRREEQALRFIKRHTEEFGRSPYQFQIAAHLKQNSRGFVCRMLDNMERKGLITRQWGVPRSIRSLA